MAADVRIHRARDADAVELYENLRKADLEECRAYGRGDVLTGILESVRTSSECWTARVPEGLVAVFGVGSVAPGVGSPWMLGTPLLDEMPRELMRVAPAYIRRMLMVYPRLLNFVHVRNERSIRWLRGLGFTIHPPEPHGYLGAMFHRFEMGG